jgi:hypothetical protein
MLAHAGTPDEFVGELLFGVAGALGWVAISRLRGHSFPRMPKAAAWGVGVLCVGAVAAGFVVPSMMRPSWSPIRPRSDARLAIVLPTPDEVVHGDALEVDIRLRGGTLTPVTSTRLSSSAGHLHVSIDGQLLSMTTASDTEVDIGGLGDGEHTLQAEFVAADHGPFKPRVLATVRFEKEP